MPCIVALFALLSPRLAIVVLWLFTDRMTIAFQSGWYAIIGFLLLPWTTLAWAICYNPFFGVSGFGLLIVAFGFILDVSSWFGGARSRR